MQPRSNSEGVGEKKKGKFLRKTWEKFDRVVRTDRPNETELQLSYIPERKNRRSLIEKIDWYTDWLTVSKSPTEKDQSIDWLTEWWKKNQNLIDK